MALELLESGLEGVGAAVQQLAGLRVQRGQVRRRAGQLLLGLSGRDRRALGLAVVALALGQADDDDRDEAEADDGEDELAHALKLTGQQRDRVDRVVVVGAARATSQVPGPAQRAAYPGADRHLD